MYPNYSSVHFSAPIAGILVNLTVPLVRSYSSKLVQPDEQGIVITLVSKGFRRLCLDC